MAFPALVAEPSQAQLHRITDVRDRHVRHVGQSRSEMEEYLLATMAWAVSLMEATARIQKETAGALQVLAARSEQAAVIQQLGRVEDAISVLASCPHSREAQLDRPDKLRQPRADTGQASWPVEPLTAREACVLRLLRGTLTLREIGQELGVSKNTIKSHTQAIYRKLRVADRHDAIGRGQDLGILLSGTRTVG
jgi:ATP/maltotriose-dependent transcriptional regulator MalT